MHEYKMVLQIIGVADMIKECLKYLRDFPKSVYFNYRCLPLKQAKKLPVRVRYDTKFGILDKNSVSINGTCKRSMITLGYRGGQFVSANRGYIGISGGKIIFNGTCNFGEGFGIAVEGGTLIFGDDFYTNRNFMAECQKKIEFGNDVLLGWNVSIRDTDGHSVNGKPFKSEITIKNHVWIASGVTVLKGSFITEDSVIACNSTVCGLQMQENKCLIAGTPAKIIKTNVEWTE